MGKSAKLHKRVKKVKSSTSTSASSNTAAGSSSATQVQAAKKRSKLKAKAAKGSSSSEKGVLGGADYLTLLEGSRKKIAEEAKKLPRDD
ncbi:hypothetical protein CVT26_000014 [Gymnopilus dilepis]|uniref:Uncharacterized protein n=1 Tax=Gymnopilus dilepis TaxID=231916 RepID=A0A409VGK2_9AGAR|nr:hypothetical protein CVT26_000014 [Gymnopilus dilepis]